MESPQHVWDVCVACTATLCRVACAGRCTGCVQSPPSGTQALQCLPQAWRVRMEPPASPTVEQNQKTAAPKI